MVKKEFKCEACGYESDEPEDFIKNAQKLGTFCNDCPTEPGFNLGEEEQVEFPGDKFKIIYHEPMYPKSKIKEFIKRLKKQAQWNLSGIIGQSITAELHDLIDKLAGSKLS